ncbi:MAG: hypothetical protein FOGNACKC_00488 [Anaerolineae bacterium]|nr:hypothetical protein [Anaerolineae bacterium]
MAKLIQAIRRYGPRVAYNNTVQLDRIADWIASRTSLNPSQVTMVLQELHECVLFFNSYGAPVKLPGLGRYAPSISRDGSYRVTVNPDHSLSAGLNPPHSFTGKVVNKANIGLGDDELTALWNAAHPDDPIE